MMVDDSVGSYSVINECQKRSKDLKRYPQISRRVRDTLAPAHELPGFLDEVERQTQLAVDGRGKRPSVELSKIAAGSVDSSLPPPAAAAAASTDHQVLNFNEPEPEPESEPAPATAAPSPAAPPVGGAKRTVADWPQETSLAMCEASLAEAGCDTELQMVIEGDEEEVADMIEAVGAIEGIKKPTVKKFKRELAKVRGKDETFA